MTDTLNAWVWAHYRGVVSDSGASETDRMKGEGLQEGRVLPFIASRNPRSEAMGQNATEARTKFGLAIAVSILVGAFFPLIALVLFLVAVLLAVSGKEPQKTEDFLRGLPGGDHAIKALAWIDGWLS